MTHGSLFNGIGGFQLAAHWMGWENVWHCEIDKFCNKVVRQHFPDSICYEDIRKFKATEWRGKIDVISGGFPCQPFSKAGQRKGANDNRHLWPEMLRVIREIQPRFVVGENVCGILNWQRGLVFEQIQIDMEGAGYQSAVCVLPAYAVGAFHNRDRVWFVSAKKDAFNPNANGFRFYRAEEHEQKGSFKLQHEQGCLPGPLVSQSIREGSDTRVFRDINGLPDRVDRIKAIGNAIVPQVAYEIFKAIELTNQNKLTA
jgi:DNA-cytosine methyltransferase